MYRIVAQYRCFPKISSPSNIVFVPDPKPIIVPLDWIYHMNDDIADFDESDDDASKKKKNQQKRIEINIAVNLFLWLHLENQIENKKEKNKNLINPGSRIVSNRCVCLQNYTSTLYLPFFFSSCFVPKRFINFENGEKFWRIHGRENRGKDLMQMKRRSSNPKP